MCLRVAVCGVAVYEGCSVWGLQSIRGHRVLGCKSVRVPVYGW